MGKSLFTYNLIIDLRVSSGLNVKSTVESYINITYNFK